MDEGDAAPGGSAGHDTGFGAGAQASDSGLGESPSG